MTPEPAVPALPPPDLVLVVACWIDAGPAPRVGRPRVLRRRARTGGQAGRRVAR
ncbi:hypothetical protein ACI780_20820 [Geodermatophilus sp. SYSU D00814]